MSDVSRGPGWWIASDGKWYPPELHPDYRPPTEQETQLIEAPVEPPPSTTRVMETPPAQPRPAPRRRRPPRTLASDVNRLWHERRGLAMGGLVLVALVVIVMIGALAGGKDKPAKVLTGPTSSTSPALVGTAPTTTEAATTTTTTTTPTTTSTTVVSTTRAPATTAATSAATTSSPPTTTPTVTAPAAVQKGVTPGAFCSPGGALGETSTGVPMVCTTTAADSRNRWRQA